MIQLLGHIAGKYLSNEFENVATEALSYLLNKSELVRKV